MQTRVYGAVIRVAQPFALIDECPILSEEGEDGGVSPPDCLAVIAESFSDDCV